MAYALDDFLPHDTRLCPGDNFETNHDTYRHHTHSLVISIKYDAKPNDGAKKHNGYVVKAEDSFHGWVFFVEIPDLKRLNLNIVKVLRFCFLATINS